MNLSLGSVERWLAGLATLGAVSAWTLFVAINVAYVANRGVCCADDGSFAVVAKNLARSLGYSLTVGYGGPDFSVRQFDAEVGTGPVLIVPVSLAIRVFGNRFWVPGMVHIVMWGLLLVVIWWNLRAIVGPLRANIGSGIFLGTVYAVSPYHFEQWYAMLGEVPAALVILLAVTVWARDPESSRRRLLAGVLLSLAVLLKQLALIYAVVFMVFVIVHGLTGRWRSVGLLASRLAPAIVGFVGPLLVFEGWKLAALGFGGYRGHVVSLIRFMGRQGRISSGWSTAELTERLLAFESRFGVALPSLLITVLFGAYLARRSGRPGFRRLFGALLAGVVVHAVYWLAFSVGWPRYFYPGLVLLCALVALPFTAIDRWAKHAWYAAALGLALLGSIGRVYGPVAGLGDRWFAAGPSRISQERIVAWMDGELHRRPFVAQWWAPVADLEYLSRNVLNFKPYPALTGTEVARGFLVVTNGRFDDPGDKAFRSLISRCGPPVMAASPYAIYECRREAVVLRGVAPPQEVQAGPWVAGRGCNLETVAGQGASIAPVAMRRGDLLGLSGWVVNEQEQSVPDRLYVVLQSRETGTRVYVPVDTEVVRADVARTLGNPAFRQSGFRGFIETSMLPPAVYEAFLVFRGMGGNFVCDNGRRLVVN